MLRAAAQHRGSALVEIYQDCPVFNDGSFDVLRKGEDAAERVIPVEHGQPIRFGPPAEDGLGGYAVVRAGFGDLEITKHDEVDSRDVVVHDTTDQTLAFALSRLSTQDLGHAVTGVFRSVRRATYDDQAREQVEQARARKPADLQQLLRGADNWTVAGPAG